MRRKIPKNLLKESKNSVKTSNQSAVKSHCRLSAQPLKIKGNFGALSHVGHARLGMTTFNKMKATVSYPLAFERVALPLHFMQSVGKTKSGKTFEKENWCSAALPITATVFFSVYLINLRVCEEPHVYHTVGRVACLGPRLKYCSLALQIYNRDKNLAIKLTSARHYSEVCRTVAN